MKVLRVTYQHEHSWGGCTQPWGYTTKDFLIDENDNTLMWSPVMCPHTMVELRQLHREIVEL